MTGETIVSEPWWERYRSDLASRETHRIELFVRSLAPVPGTHRRRASLVERLEELDASDRVDEFDVTILGEELCLCDTCRETAVGSDTLDSVQELREWGGENATPLAFDERRVDCSITGEEYTVLVPPTTCLAASVDDELQAVFPCRIDGRAYDVTDFVDALSHAETQPEPSRADA